MSLKTYHGSCHCGKVKFEADLDLSKGTGRCNCSFCGKTRNWTSITQPDKFRLLTSAQDVGEYKFSDESLSKHLFCKNCGVRFATKGFVEEIGGHYVSVVLATLDDATPEELLSGPITYMDGLHNNWQNPPPETKHL
jgi:hypothetical protein